MTRARALAEQGLHRPSILSAEVLSQRAPDSVPQGLWPEELSRLLYPMAYGTILRAEAVDAALDPRLLAALIREESRFDPTATSAAAARGLTQFVLPTARRLGQILGLGELDAEALYRPEIAVRLGAAYLAELGVRFGDREHWMLAAYNAGEAQAELWGDYCFSDEPAEYLTKVGFRETRNYLRKVLRSYAWYRELYGRALGRDDARQRPLHGVEVVLDVRLAAQLLRPAVDLFVQPLFLEHRADRLPHVLQRWRLRSPLAHLGHESAVVVGPNVLEIDEDPRSQALFHVGEHHELAGDELPQAVGLEAELAQARLERGVARKPGADLLEPLLDLARGQLDESEAVDLVEPETLLDELVEDPPSQGRIALALALFHHPRAGRPGSPRTEGSDPRRPPRSRDR